MEKKAALNLLQPFIGAWKTTGVITQGLGRPDVMLRGTDTYEWLPGGFFMLHKVDVLMGEDHNESFEIIGFDEHAQIFTMHAFDNKGIATAMTAAYQQDQWRFSNADLKFEGGGFSNHGTVLSGNWYQRDDQGNWQQTIRIRLEQDGTSQLYKKYETGGKQA